MNVSFEQRQVELQTAFSGGLSSGAATRKRSKSNLNLVEEGQQLAQLQPSVPLAMDSYVRMRDRSGAVPRRFITLGGLTVNLEYILDYAVVIVAIMILIISDKATPRAGYIRKDLLSATNYPLKSNTVPSWSVPVITIVAPAAFFAVYTIVLARRPAQLHNLILGLLTSVLVTGAITNIIKCPVGRLRPDFNARCWPDGKVLWNKEDTYGGWANCSGNPDSVEEGRKSFPSGHSSWAASGLSYVTWFLLDVLQPFDGSGHPWRLMTACLPALGALAVGITRYTDYWHHWSDIFAGLLLGTFMSWLVYRQQQTKGQVENGMGNGPVQGAAGTGFGGLEGEALMERSAVSSSLLPSSGSRAGLPL